MRASAQLDVYGLKIAVGGEWPEVVEAVRLDFAWFEQNDVQDIAVDVEIERRPPDFAAFGELAAAFVTLRNVVYQDNGCTVVDYFGRAVSVYDRRSRRLVIQGKDEHLVHEAAYHFVLSSVGEHLEHRGLSRLHALGLVGAQGGVAVMLPSGGGKGTLALRAIKSDGIKLLSEDTPLLDRHGHLHPFPPRIGVNATEAAELPAGKVRRLERMEFHPKFVLELDAFADRIQTTPVPLRHLVIGRRTLGRDARLEPLPRRAAVGTLLRELVFGVGVYQGMEFVLQHGMRDIFGRLRPAVTARGAAWARLLRPTFGASRSGGITSGTGRLCGRYWLERTTALGTAHVCPKWWLIARAIGET